MRRFLLDTNILLGLARKADWARRTHSQFNLGDPDVISFTSVVCKGEILAIAERNGWGPSKRTTLDRMLREFPDLPIKAPDILRAYALIDAWSCGRSVPAPRNALPPKPSVPMGKNDLWIAATAHASGAILLSTDGDFEHLASVWFRYERIDQVAV